MPQIQWGLSSYERTRGDLPGLPVVNMVAEKAPTEEAQIMLQSRPELEDRAADMGSGPIQALFKRDNVLSTALFGVSDGSLYSGTTLVGALDGAGPFSLAGYELILFMAGGASLWGYDGTTLAAVAFPDSADVVKVIIAASRAVTVRRDTGKFYWTDALGDTITGLTFATAENQPDRTLDLLYIDGILIIFGAETVERWATTTNNDLPFSPMQGAVIEKGIRATGCATSYGSIFAWVTNENNVCVQDENNIISNEGLQAKIEASATCSLFTFLIEGTEYLALRLDSETQVYAKGFWSEFASHSYANWLPQCWAGGVFGSAADGKTMQWGAGHEDLGGVLERRFRAGFPLNSGGLHISNVGLRCNVGQTPFLTGDYTNPQVEMRLSRDAGQTWGDWRQTNLGGQGEYRTKPIWRGCGQASYPGFLAEFRLTDPVDWRVSGVLVNEGYGGR